MGDDPKPTDTRDGITAHTIVTPSPFDDAGTPIALVPGMLVGKYELIREIGRGGMGIVYVARDTRLGRRVAIKFVMSSSRVIAERFLVEARATAECNHDNIVIIHEADEYFGMPYMVLELLEGQSLRELIARSTLTPTRVLELVLPVARALVRAHELGIVHRDLKPENILVTLGGQVKVVDFGIAKALASRRLARQSKRDMDLDLVRTSDGALVGTLPYMPPEQLLGGDVDHRADLWACGIIIFELLAGRHPITPLTNEAIFECLASEAAMPALQNVAPEVPPGFAEIVDACLRKNPDERIAGAHELVARLEALLPQRTQRTDPDATPYPGLVAFQEADADRFFGRARDSARVVARLREAPLIAVVGPSGVGKSSFVRAGLAPALKASGEELEMIVVRPGRHPLMTLATLAERIAMRQPVPGNQRVGNSTANIAAVLLRLRVEPGFLGALLRKHAHAIEGRVVLFIDQLEELYTLGADVAARRAFTAVLAGIADDVASPLRVVLSMRSDLLDRVAEDAAFMELVTRGLVLLAPPDSEGLRDALVAPVEQRGYRFESEDMVRDIVAELSGVPGALPLLQFTAGKLWDARDRARRVLTLASYHAIGGISGALATHADEVIANMDAQSRQIARELFRRLVTPERTRAVVELAELGGSERTIDQLVAARLLVVQTHAASGSSVELVHESLIERWPTLRRWLDEDQDDAAYAAEIAAAAKQWEARGRAVGLLWRGDAAAELRRWSHARPRTLPARDRAFVGAVFALASRRRRVRLVAVVGAFVTLIAIATGASVAYVAVREAKADAESKLKAALEAEARRAAAVRESADARAAADRAEQARTQITSERDVAQDAVRAKERELADKNAALEQALAQARAEQARAERSSQEAKRAADEANRAREGLAESVAAKTARIQQLEEEKKRLSTKLKE